MLLIIVKTDDEKVAKKVGLAIPSVELVEGVYLTWAPREKVARLVDAMKGEVVKTWEEVGRGPYFEAAVLELTEEQSRQVRNMAKTVLEKTAEAMLEELERFTKRAKSNRGERIYGWYRDLARRYQRLLDISLALGIEPTAVGRLKEKWKEATIEVGFTKKR